jgi:cell division protein FtsB
MNNKEKQIEILEEKIAKLKKMVSKKEKKLKKLKKEEDFYVSSYSSCGGYSSCGFY